MKIITIFLIAVSLSMDAFSLALIYGTQGINKKDKIILSLIVGIYHFVMPLIGLSIGIYITNKLIINASILVGITSFKDEEERFLLTLPGYLIFGLSVSVDSLTTGIGLPAIAENYFLTATIFSITSLIFTYLGLNLGNILNKKYGKVSTIIGGSILFSLGIIYIFK